MQLKKTTVLASLTFKRYRVNDLRHVSATVVDQHNKARARRGLCYFLPLLITVAKNAIVSSQHTQVRAQSVTAW